MEYGIALICLLLVIVAYILGRVGYAVEKDEDERPGFNKMNESDNGTNKEEGNNTRDLVVKTLKEIGCQPEIDDDDIINVKYKDSCFKIYTITGNKPIIYILESA